MWNSFCRSEMVHATQESAHQSARAGGTVSGGVHHGTLALSSCSCAWRSASRRYASRSSSADRSESDGLLVYESAEPCQETVGGGCWWCRLWLLQSIFSSHTFGLSHRESVTEPLWDHIDLQVLFLNLLSVSHFCRPRAQVCMQRRAHVHQHACACIYNTMLSHTSRILADQI